MTDQEKAEVNNLLQLLYTFEAAKLVNEYYSNYNNPDPGMLLKAQMEKVLKLVSGSYHDRAVQA